MSELRHRSAAAAGTAGRRLVATVPGAAALLRRPQLRRAYAARWVTTRTRSRRSSSEDARCAAHRRQVPLSAGTKDVHYEIELVVALKSGGRDIKAGDALSHVLRLRHRPRHDAPRPAGRGEEDSAARGRSARRSTTRRRAPRSMPAVEDRPSVEGRDLARRQRRAQADRRPRADDLGYSRRRSSICPACSS